MQPNGIEPRAIESSSEATDDLAERIDALTLANRAARDAGRERELLRLRYESFLASGRGAALPETPAPVNPPIAIDPAVGLPVVHRLPSAGVVRSTIRAHGSLVVRGLVGPQGVARLQTAVNETIAARGHLLAGNEPTGASPWYAEFGPIKEVGARAFTASSGALAVDSPRGIFELIETFREAGVDRLAAEFLGGRPVISAEKSVFRRVEPTLFATWHQDGAFLGENIRTLDVWIALSSCGKTAPSLEVLPRRVSRILPTGACFSWDLDDKEIEKEFPGFTTVLAQFEPGDAILFDQLCVHRSGHAAGMTLPRLAIECWLFAAESVPEGYTGLVL